MTNTCLFLWNLRPPSCPKNPPVQVVPEVSCPSLDHPHLPEMRRVGRPFPTNKKSTKIHVPTVHKYFIHWKITNISLINLKSFLIQREVFGFCMLSSNFGAFVPLSWRLHQPLPHSKETCATNHRSQTAHPRNNTPETQTWNPEKKKKTFQNHCVSSWSGFIDVSFFMVKVCTKNVSHFPAFLVSAVVQPYSSEVFEGQPKRNISWLINGTHQGNSKWSSQAPNGSVDLFNIFSTFQT